MKRIMLVTGGARSGKSGYAEQRVAEIGRRRLYVATAEAKDDEMTRRIDQHRLRRDSLWITVEEPFDLAGALLVQSGKIDGALVDCVTLWVSNLLFREGEAGVKNSVDALLARLPLLDFAVCFVTNEVGSAVVPDNRLARSFRDLLGWANQRLAAAAHEVVLMVAGIPVVVKKSP